MAHCDISQRDSFTCDRVSMFILINPYNSIDTVVVLKEGLFFGFIVLWDVG